MPSELSFSVTSFFFKPFLVFGDKVEVSTTYQTCTFRSRQIQDPLAFIPEVLRDVADQGFGQFLVVAIEAESVTCVVFVIKVAVCLGNCSVFCPMTKHYRTNAA